MSQPLPLHLQAEEETARLPTLLAEADHLAGTVLLGEHGRRRAGTGDDFWQYRPVQTGDSRRLIDWRKSARSDAVFVREREWQIAQSVMLWVDTSASMHFTSDKMLPKKADRARLIGLATAILLIRSGERVGMTGTELPPRRGRAQIMRLADVLSTEDNADYGVPKARAMIPHARALFISDCLGDLSEIEKALTKAADRGVRGTLLQVLDPSEEAFPFSGRTIFESAGKTLSHETLKAADLKTRYLDRLAERKTQLQSLCATTGWQFQTHHTDASAQSALLWVHGAIGTTL